MQPHSSVSTATAAAATATYTTIPISPADVIARSLQNLSSSFSLLLRPTSQFLPLSLTPFDRPSPSSSAKSRLLKNASYFRLNYALILLSSALPPPHLCPLPSLVPPLPLQGGSPLPLGPPAHRSDPPHRPLTPLFHPHLRNIRGLLESSHGVGRRSRHLRPSCYSQEWGGIGFGRMGSRLRRFDISCRCCCSSSFTANCRSDSDGDVRSLLTLNNSPSSFLV